MATTRRDLNRLLRPRSIAVFGGAWARQVIEQCQRMNYDGQLFPVHPELDVIAGLRCYPGVSHLPTAPDASFIGVNRDATIDIVAQLARRGSGGAVCFAAGFSESVVEDASGVNRQSDLLAAAGAMPVIGPNCYGFINYLDGALLWPDQHGGRRLDDEQSGVALLTQSSNVAINLTMQRRGLPIAYVLTAGNQAQTTLAELAVAVLDDPRVTAIGMHIEGFASLEKFTQMARHAHALGKPVVVLKVGRTPATQTALISHTSSLSGSTAATDAFLQQLGVERVYSLNVLLETLKILHVAGPLTDRRVLSMSCSGGEAVLMADAIDSHGLTCPELDSTQHVALRNALGPRVALANPLDYQTTIWNDAIAMQAMFAAMLKGSASLAVLLLDFPRNDRCDNSDWLLAMHAFQRAGQGWQGALAVMASLPENMSESVAQRLLHNGIIPLLGLDDSVQAIAHAVACHESKERVQAQHDIPAAVAWSHKIQPHTANLPGVGSHDEHQTKQWLLSLGVTIPNAHCLNPLQSSSVEKIQLALESADLTACYPLVVKALGVTHKSDANALVLNIHSQQQLVAAITRTTGPAGCLIEAQVENCIVELLVSVVRDPVHGLIMTVGAGGELAELMSDTQHLLIPTTEEKLRVALNRLRCSKLLNGYRSKPSVAWRSLIENILAVQSAAMALGERLIELEINPFVCTTERCVAVDALLVTRHVDEINGDR